MRPLESLLRRSRVILFNKTDKTWREISENFNIRQKRTAAPSLHICHPCKAGIGLTHVVYI